MARLSVVPLMAHELLAQEVGDALGDLGRPLDGRGVRAAGDDVQLRVADEPVHLLRQMRRA